MACLRVKLLLQLPTCLLAVTTYLHLCPSKSSPNLLYYLIYRKTTGSLGRQNGLVTTTASRCPVMPRGQHMTCTRDHILPDDTFLVTLTRIFPLSVAKKVSSGGIRSCVGVGYSTVGGGIIMQSDVRGAIGIYRRPPFGGVLQICSHCSRRHCRFVARVKTVPSANKNLADPETSAQARRRRVGARACTCRTSTGAARRPPSCMRRTPTRRRTLSGPRSAGISW
jgi:hypothetical protein